MKIVNEPPKTGEEFTVSWIDSDNKAMSLVMRFNKEWEMFEVKEHTSWLSIVKPNQTFKGTTILVSKGE